VVLEQFPEAGQIESAGDFGPLGEAVEDVVSGRQAGGETLLEVGGLESAAPA
jgi:hypothetical protein